MSQENVEIVRAVFEEFLAGGNEFDAEGTLTKVAGEEFWDPNIEWDASSSPLPDGSGVFRGKDAVRAFWREWLAAWETTLFDYELVGAEDRVVALIDQRMLGRSNRHRSAHWEVRANFHLQGRPRRPLEALREPVGSPRRRRAAGVGDVAGERGDRAQCLRRVRFGVCPPTRTGMRSTPRWVWEGRGEAPDAGFVKAISGVRALHAGLARRFRDSWLSRFDEIIEAGERLRRRTAGAHEESSGGQGLETVLHYAAIYEGPRLQTDHHREGGTRPEPRPSKPPGCGSRRCR